MAKCGTVSLAVAAVATVCVCIGLFQLYTGVTKLLDKQAETIGGVITNGGATDQISPALVPSEGPLQIFINGTLGHVDSSVCDSVFDSLSVTFVNWSAPEFSLDDFGTTVPAGGLMALNKDCVPGSLGGIYEGVTVVANMPYTPVCQTNCDQYVFMEFLEAQLAFTVGYQIVSPNQGVFAIAMVLILETRKTFDRAWETAGGEFTWFMIWAAVGAVVGVGACFVMEEEGSDEQSQELA